MFECEQPFVGRSVLFDVARNVVALYLDVDNSGLRSRYGIAPSILQNIDVKLHNNSEHLSLYRLT